MFQALLRSDILVKLPQSTDDVAVMTKGGIYVSTLAHKEKYNPTHGTVVQIAPDVKNIQIGDEVFFGNHLWDVAKRRAFGEDDKRFKGHYYPDKVFAVKESAMFTGQNDTSYMIVPSTMLYFLKRGDELVGLNRFVIAEPIPKKEQISDSGLVLVDLDEENYVKNMATVFLAPEGCDLEKGDVIHTLNHCDLTLEEELNAPILPAKYFFIELDDILAKETADAILV